MCIGYFLDWAPIPAAPICPVAVPVRTISSDVFLDFFPAHFSIILNRFLEKFSYVIRSDGVMLIQIHYKPACDGNFFQQHHLASIVANAILEEVSVIRWFNFRDRAIKKRLSRINEEENTDDLDIIANEGRMVAFEPVPVANPQSTAFISTIPESMRSVFMDGDIGKIAGNDFSLALLRVLRDDFSVSKRYAVLKFREKIASSFSVGSVVRELKRIRHPSNLRQIEYLFFSLVFASILATTLHFMSLSPVNTFLLVVTATALGYYIFEVGVHRRRSIRTLRDLNGILILGNIYSVVAERIYGKARIILGCADKCSSCSSAKNANPLQNFEELPCCICQSNVQTGGFSSSIDMIAMKISVEENKIRARREFVVGIIAIFISLKLIFAS